MCDGPRGEGPASALLRVGTFAAWSRSVSLRELIFTLLVAKKELSSTPLGMRNTVLAICVASTVARVYSSDRIYFESDFSSSEMNKMSSAATSHRPTVVQTELTLRQPLPTEYQPPSTAAPPPSAPPPSLPPYVPGPLDRGINTLTHNLETLLDNEKNYVLFSPLSVAGALSLVLLGAGGQTLTELAAFLGVRPGVGYEADGDDQIHGEIARFFGKIFAAPVPGTVRFANGVFIQNDLQVSSVYLNNVRRYYFEEVIGVDFRHQGPLDAMHHINKWAANRTRGQVPRVVTTPFPAETTAVFINVLYFQGEWKTPFCLPCVKWGNFYVSSTETVRVQLMPNIGDAYFLEDKSRGFKLLGLPYKGSDMAMYFILPTKGPKKFLSGNSIEEIHNLVGNASLQETIYVVPKMKLESTIDMNEPLRKMGLKSLFTPSADLRGISHGIWVDSVLQKLEIDITETGTRAVVSTMISSTRGGHRPTVRLDKPFIFFVYARHQRLIHFWGTVYKPTPSEAKAPRRPALRAQY